MRGIEGLSVVIEEIMATCLREESEEMVKMEIGGLVL